MDDADLMHRLLDAMRAMIVVGDDGVARVNPEIEALERELTVALEAPEHSPELALLAQQLRTMREAAADPRVAASMAESMAAAADPQPDIFEVIDEGDPAEIRAVLGGIDVNARYGRYDKTALYHAIASVDAASLDVMTLLLDSGADPRLGLTDTNVLHGLGFGNLSGMTAEELAIFVRRCVGLGADLEERTNKLQWTPLITAVSEWNPIATEALLLAGANINVKAGDVDGVCLAGEGCIAFAEGHAPTIAVLKRYLTE